AFLCAAGMWFYVERVLVPYQRADAEAHDRPRGNLSDLYPRWLGARELLLHHRNPYSKEITREIQIGYYGRALDPGRPGDPKDQQVVALLAGACALLVSGHRFSSGTLLAVATIKPHLALPLASVLLLWTLSDWRRRQRLFWGFTVAMLLLAGTSEILLPGWFGDFLLATGDYRRYAGGLSILQVMLSPWVGLVAAGVLVVAVADVCWRFRKQESDQPSFVLMLALTLAATIIIIPMFAPYNFLLMLPAIFLIVKDRRRLWAGGAISRTG